MAENNSSSLMEKVISLSKQRGFVFQSSEIYGGLKSAYFMELTDSING